MTPEDDHREPPAPESRAAIDPGEPDATSRDRPRARRLAPLLLIVGGIAAASFVLPHVPHERVVELAPVDARTVTSIDVTWTPAGDRDAVHGASWRFEPGAAPRSVEASVSLPDGRYDLDIALERGNSRTTVQRSVTLSDADHVTVPLP